MIFIFNYTRLAGEVNGDEGDIAERIKRNYARIMENIEAEAVATSAARAPKVQPDPRD